MWFGLVGASVPGPTPFPSAWTETTSCTQAVGNASMKQHRQDGFWHLLHVWPWCHVYREAVAGVAFSALLDLSRWSKEVGLTRIACVTLAPIDWVLTSPSETGMSPTILGVFNQLLFLYIFASAKPSFWLGMAWLHAFSKVDLVPVSCLTHRLHTSSDSSSSGGGVAWKQPGGVDTEWWVSASWYRLGMATGGYWPTGHDSSCHGCNGCGGAAPKNGDEHPNSKTASHARTYVSGAVTYWVEGIT